MRIFFRLCRYIQKISNFRKKTMILGLTKISNKIFFFSRMEVKVTKLAYLADAIRRSVWFLSFKTTTKKAQQSRQ